MEVERFGQAERIPVGCHIKVRNLACCVHARICSARTLDALVALFQHAQGGFDAALDRSVVYLALPTDKRFAVVFDFECVSGHLCAIAGVCMFAKSMKRVRATLH